MKKELLKTAITTLMCCVAVGAMATDVTREQAILAVQSDRSSHNLSNSCVRFYVAPTDTVINNFWCWASTINARSWVKNNTPKWLVFVDEQPLNPMWSHPCRYYYLPRQVSNLSSLPVVSYEGEFKPDLDGLYCPEFPSPTVVLNADSVCDSIVYPESHIGFPVYPPNGGLHVAIIAGGYTPTTHSLSFYNDTKFLYNVLRRKYHIDKSRIHVLMADGGNDSIDMVADRNNIARVSTDLDNDGLSDIETDASYNSIASLFTAWSETLTPADHLLVVFDMHGDDDGTIHPLGPPLTKYDLRCMLNAIPSASQCLILNTCHSGKGIDILKDDKRVILTSANETDSYGDFNFNYFIHEWTSAINEANMTDSLATDSDGNGFVSMYEAFNYAQDINNYEYNPDGGPDVEPQNATNNGFLLSDWAINHLPDPTALYIKDFGQDNGLDGYTIYCNQMPALQSPDIIITPVSDPPGHLNIKTTIHNRGYKQYDGEGRYLHLHWRMHTGANDTIPRWNWIGAANDLTPNAPEFAIVPIDRVIPSGGAITMCTEWALPQALLAQTNKYEIDILARISDSSQPVIHDHSGLLYPFTYNKLDDTRYAGNMATCHVACNPSVNTSVSTDFAVTAPADGEISLCVLTDAIASGLTLTLTLDSQLALAATGDATPADIQLSGGDTIVFTGLTPGADYTIPLSCTVNPQQVTGTGTAVIPIKVVSTASNAIIDATMLQVTVAPRDEELEPDISEEDGGDAGEEEGEGWEANGIGRCLMMTNVSEPVSCQWTDAAGTILGTADTLAIPDNASGGYTLTVTAFSDNATASVTRILQPRAAISNLSANGGDITVTLRRKACQGTTITVQPAIGNEQTRSFNIQQGTKTATLNTSDMASGQYMVSLYVNNQLKETKQIIK